MKRHALQIERLLNRSRTGNRLTRLSGDAISEVVADFDKLQGGSRHGRKYVVLTILMVSGLRLDDVVRLMLLSLQPYFAGFDVTDLVTLVKTWKNGSTFGDLEHVMELELETQTSDG